MKTEEFMHLLDTLLKPELQDSYDNSGPQVLFRGIEVGSVMVALDTDRRVIDEAIEKRCCLLITHHPLFFKPMNVIDSHEAFSSLVVRLIEERLSLYSAHTNLDRLYRDRLARRIGLVDIVPLGRPEEGGLSASDDHGVRGILERPSGLREFVETIKIILDLDHCILAGDSERKVQRIAVLNGAGGRRIEPIIASGAVDCIITGDVGYHQARYAEQAGVALVDAGHFGTEIIFPDMLANDIREYVRESLPSTELTIHVAESEKSPFTVC
jgi:dinuclear metal center YbgI/SA1388 family protein